MAVAYTDVFGSVARRAAQDEKDAAEVAQERVLSLPVLDGGDKKTGPFWNTRPIIERVLARTSRVKTESERGVRHYRRQFKRGVINKAQMRAEVARVQETDRVRGEEVLRVFKPTIMTSPRHTRYDARLARRPAK